LEFAVGVDQLIRLDDPRQQRIMRHIEPDPTRPGQKGDDVDLDDGKHAEEGGDRNCRQAGEPQQVGGQHDSAAIPPIRVDAGDQREQEKRKIPKRGHDAELERRVGHLEHQPRQRQQRDLVASARDDGPSPDAHEGGMPE
jgi:hypothetical protein